MSQLLAEGYDISIQANHLVVKRIPYVNAERQIKYGMLVTVLRLQNDVTLPPDDHTIYFVGEYPCDANGQPIEAIRNGPERTSIGNLTTDHRFSAKPQPSGKYDDFHHKIVTYAALLSGPAQTIDPGVKPNPGGFIPAEEDDDSVFLYLDTASPRAEITAVTAKLERKKVVIVGLGGTGCYVLDFVAKTPVEEVHLYDDDTFEQHNAFRAPGAASGDELSANSTKVAYLAGIYCKMRRGIVAHPERVGASNIEELRDADFVFLCIDDGPSKGLIIAKLEEFGVSFVDAGMGLFLEDGALGGILRTTTSTPTMRDHVRDGKRISLSKDEGENEYERNIQVADLNALNAIMAVMKWKKLWGFYIDLEREHHSTYTIDGNEMTNEDCE